VRFSLTGTRDTLQEGRDLGDLAIPPDNHPERLKGNRAGQHSIRINERYRICFRWENGHADEVEIADCH
jgi:proteic killer suppression protein